MTKGWSLGPPDSDWDDSVFQEPLSLPGKREKQSYRARSLTHALYQGAADPLAYSLVFPRDVQRPPVVERQGGKNSVVPEHFLESRMCSQRDHETMYLCIFKKNLIRRSHRHLQMLLMQQFPPALKDYYF